MPDVTASVSAAAIQKKVKREAFFMWDAIGRPRGLNVLGYQMS